MSGDAAEYERQQQEELFHRDLYEVRLLMDFVSGRADKSLNSLVGLPTAEADGKLVPASWDVAVRQVCEIHFPLEGGASANPAQATLLLTLKDQLNEIAAPARGLTIAYTSMFAGVTTSYVEQVWSWWGRPAKREDASASAARAAYPALESHAQQFQRYYRKLPIYALFVIVLVSLINWDVSVTNSEVQRIVVADTEYAKLFAPGLAFIPTAAQCGPLEASDKAANPDAATVGKLLQCEREHDLLTQRRESRAELRRLFNGVTALVRPIGFTVKAFGPDTTIAACEETDSRCLAAAAAVSNSLQNYVVAVLAGFTGVVVPALFGLLGTLAGVVRSVAAKVRDSVLAPRDYIVSVSAVFLGLVAGAAVGLIYNDSEAAAATGKSFGITLSAAGLSFLAGYGADSFFKAMDRLKGKLFAGDDNGDAGTGK